MNNALKQPNTDSSIGLSDIPSSKAIAQFRSPELIIGIVGPIGSGTEIVVKEIEEILGDFNLDLVKKIKLSDLIIKKAGPIENIQLPTSEDLKNKNRTIEDVKLLQHWGDCIRKGKYNKKKKDEDCKKYIDPARVIRLFFNEIQEIRPSDSTTESNKSNDSTNTQDLKRVYIIDSLKHPSEVSLLRNVYKEAFCLLGVHCERETRENRVIEQYKISKRNEKKMSEVQEYLDSDEKSNIKYGQQVSDTFQESDYFVDTTLGKENNLTEHISRFLGLITQSKITRPTKSETAMVQANAFKMRSSCLSRQVGAVLTNSEGKVIAGGTNDVPKPGGGIYGENDSISDTVNISENSYKATNSSEEFKLSAEVTRCIFAQTPFCSNSREQIVIIKDFIEKFPELSKDKSEIEIDELIEKIRKETRIGGLLEFSRAVHAEMAAIISAAMSGISTKNCVLFVTTFPCHYCARHIVNAGITEVQYIEAYPKSKAIDLHSDSIRTNLTPKTKQNTQKFGKKVLFRPFVGVSPNLYYKVFEKNKDYKNPKTGMFMLSPSEWGEPIQIYSKSYLALEKELLWK